MRLVATFARVVFGCVLILLILRPLDARAADGERLIFTSSDIRRQHDHDYLPPLWQEAPEDLSKYQVDVEGESFVTTIDPWQYKDRLGMLKILIHKTKDKFHDFGRNNSANLLWGIALQLGWQFSTLRLRDQANTSYCNLRRYGTCISPFSWWAANNYYLTILPFLGAQQAGYFNDWPLRINILHPDANVPLFCYDAHTCQDKAPEALLYWTQFFRVLNEQQTNPDVITAHLWRAHLSSLTVSLPLSTNLTTHMADLEGQFGLSWGHFVEYAAAAYIPTDLFGTYTFQNLILPQRLFRQNETLPISEFPKTVNEALKILFRLRWLDSKSGDKVLSFWKSATCSRRGRRLALSIADDMANGKWSIYKDLAELVWLRIWEKCDRPI